MYKPGRNLKPLDDLICDIEELKLEEHPSQFVIIGGDLNLPGMQWHNINRESVREETLRVARLLDLGFTQMVTEPTRTTDHSSNILDVLLTNQPHKISEVSIEDKLGDHQIVTAQIISKHKVHQKAARKIFLYHKADVGRLKFELQQALPKFEELCQQNRDISTIYSSLVSIIEEATTKCIPAKTTKNQLTHHGIIEPYVL